MPADLVSWAVANPGAVLFGILGLVALTWAAQAYLEADDRREALAGFGGRAKSGTGGAFNVALVSFVSIAGWAATTFGTAGEAVAWLVMQAPDMPVLSAGVITISLGALGLSDLIVLRPLHFVLFGALALALAVAYRSGFGSGGFLS